MMYHQKRRCHALCELVALWTSALVSAHDSLDNCSNAIRILGFSTTGSNTANTVTLTAVYAVPCNASYLNVSTAWYVGAIENGTNMTSYRQIASGRTIESLQLTLKQFAENDSAWTTSRVHSSTTMEENENATESQTISFTALQPIDEAFNFTLSFNALVRANNTTAATNSDPPTTASDKIVQKPFRLVRVRQVAHITVCRYQPIPCRVTSLRINRLTHDGRVEPFWPIDEGIKLPGDPDISISGEYQIVCSAAGLPRPSVQIYAVFGTETHHLHVLEHVVRSWFGNSGSCPIDRHLISVSGKAVLRLSDYKTRGLSKRLTILCEPATSNRTHAHVEQSFLVADFRLSQLPADRIHSHAFLEIQNASGIATDVEQLNSPEAMRRYQFFEGDRVNLSCIIADVRLHEPMVVRLARARDANLAKQSCSNGITSMAVSRGIGVKRTSVLVRRLLRSDSGTYRCCAHLQIAGAQVSNETSSDEQVDYSSIRNRPEEAIHDDVILVVAGADRPLFEHPEMETISVEQESALTLRCGLKIRDVGAPPTIVVWSKDGYDTEHSSSPGSQQNETLTFTAGNTEVEGAYRCTAFNRFGNSSKLFHVKVVHATQPPNVKLLLGSSLGGLALTLLLAAAVACLLWRYWLKNSKMIREMLRRHAHGYGGINVIADLAGLQRILADRCLEINPKSLIIRDEIGNGNFCKVLRGTLRLPEQRMPNASCGKKIALDVAIKMPRKKDDPDEIRHLIAELEVMCAVGVHPNVLQLYGAVTKSIEKNGIFFVVSEFCCYGSLDTLLLSKREELGIPPFDNTIVAQLILFGYQAASGLNYLSRRDIIHRDIAARNVLVGEGYTVKIADFGLSKAFTTKYTSGVHTQNQPVPWLAPESLSDAVFSTETDIWSFGVLLWEIFALGSVPFADMANCNSDEKDITKRIRLPRPKFAPIEVYNLMQQCWSVSPATRPRFWQCEYELHRIGMFHFPLQFNEIVLETSVQPKKYGYVTCGIRTVLDTQL